MSLLRQKRQERGLSMKDLAEQLGVTYSTISTWETGHDAPGIKNLKKIAAFFDESVDLFAKDFKIDPDLLVPPTTEGKRISREEYQKAVKKSIDKIVSILGESRSSIMTAEFMAADLERRLW